MKPTTYPCACPHDACKATINVVARRRGSYEGRCICGACVVRVEWPDEDAPVLVLQDAE